MGSYTVITTSREDLALTWAAQKLNPQKTINQILQELVSSYAKSEIESHKANKINIAMEKYKSLVPDNKLLVDNFLGTTLD